MRALIWCSALSLGLEAATLELALSAGKSPTLNFDQNSLTDSFTVYSSRLTLEEWKLSDSFYYTQSVALHRFDKAQYGLLDAAQIEVHSKNSSTNEVRGASALAYRNGKYSGSLGASYPLGKNFVSQYGLETSHALSFFNQSSTMGVAYRFLQESRPLSYFLDFDFVVKPRPARTDAHEPSLFYEQLLSENLKIRLRTFALLRPEERPNAYGGEFMAGLAATPSNFFKLRGLYAWENTGDSLRNERGYFKLLSVGLSWDYELNYSNLLGLSYTYQREDESNPRNRTGRTLGLDAVGAFFERRISKFVVKLSGDYARSNLNANFWTSTLSLRRDL